MNITCKKCGVELELPDEYCENGAHFKCYECGSRFAYFNGEGVELKESAPTRIPLPNSRKRAACGVSRRSVETKSHVDAVSLRFGRWWGCLTNTHRRIFLAVVGVALLVVVISGVRSCENAGENPMRKEYEKLVSIQKKYGTNSVEYVEQRIKMIRSVTLPMRLEMAAAHKKFEDRIFSAGYVVQNTLYSNGLLDSLFVVELNSGASGFMKKSLSEKEFSFPAWMSPSDARAIWEHYYFEAVDRSEQNLKETEKLIADLEDQLKRLRSR